MQNIAIIIPCFNESKRLNQKNIDLLLGQLPEAIIFFVNDGCTDETLSKLEELQSQYIEKIRIIKNEKNIGKAASVQKAALLVMAENKFKYLAYIDADFSAPVSEFIRLYNMMNIENPQFVIGSRIKNLNASIQRSALRHLIGRTISTLLDHHLKLGVYDTQCGLKIFSNSVANEIFEKPFYTSWLFDVEILARLKKNNLLQSGKEVPLLKWNDVGGSKLKISHFWKIINEIRLIYKQY